MKKPTEKELINNKYTEDEIRSWKFVNWVYVIRYQNLSEEFIRAFQDEVNWVDISYYQKLSEEFIREFQDKVNWVNISGYQKLSKEFILEFIDKICWIDLRSNTYISDKIRKFKTKEEFLESIKEKPTRKQLINNKYTEEELRFWADGFDQADWCRISCEQKLSEDFIEEFSHKIHWVYISTYQKLSKSFIIEFIDRIYWNCLCLNEEISEDIKQFKTKEEFLESMKENPTLEKLENNKYTEEELRNWAWNEISCKQELSEEFIREFSNKVNWEYISKYQSLSKDFVIEFINKIRWSNLKDNKQISEDIKKEFLELMREKPTEEELGDTNYSEKTLRKWADEFDKADWEEISFYQELSENFIRDFANKVNWNNISQYQALSEGFIREFSDRVNWNNISQYQVLFEGFIREFSDRVNWYNISQYQVLSEGFIREFSDKISWVNISWRQVLSEDFIREFQNKVDWRNIGTSQKLSKSFIVEFIDKLDWYDLCINEEISEDIKQFKTKAEFLAVKKLENINISENEEQMTEKTTKKSFKEIIVDDLHEAKYRLARSQLLDVGRDIVVNILEKEESTKEHAESVKHVLNSKAGEAVLSSVIGYGLTYASGELIEDERIQNIAEEFRINGLHRIEEAIFNVIFEAITPNIMETLTNSLEELPMKENIEEEVEEDFVEVEYNELQYKQV